MSLSARPLPTGIALALCAACASAPSVPPQTGSRVEAADAPKTAASTESTELATTPPALAEDDGDPKAEEAYDYTHESLGEVSFELDAAGVEAVLGAPAEKSAVIEQEADGAFVTTWEWPLQGVEIRLSSESPRGPFQVSSIAARAPSALRTAKGIGLGATPAAIREAYGSEHTHVGEGSVLVGSSYGGLHFELEAGKVSAIFIGAGAE